MRGYVGRNGDRDEVFIGCSCTALDDDSAIWPAFLSLKFIIRISHYGLRRYIWHRLQYCLADKNIHVCCKKFF